MYPKPKKSLSQNFLIDKNIRNKILAACDFGLSDIVLEIGAGRGELTHLLADRVRRLYAVEIDRALAEILKNDFKGNKKVKVIHNDILKINLREEFRGFKKKIKVIGNIPYRITTPIIQSLLGYRAKIEVIFLTVQKEFARRIQASAGSKDYGAFSCFVQYFTIPKILFTVKSNSFYPVPGVDSCFLRLELREKPAVKAKSERSLFTITRAAFNQRRKTLRNSLAGIISDENLDRFFIKYRIDRNIRPELLSLQDFANLTRI